MKKLKKAGYFAVGLTLCVLLGLAVYRSGVRVESKKHNLVTIDTSSLPEPLIEPTEETDIVLSDFTMHYARYGSGEKTVILIHGNASNHKKLEELALYLGTKYTVYGLDSRCHGESTDPGEISYDLMADDVVEFITKMNIEKPYIYGHSDGAIVALDLASRYPNIPAGVISCGANSKPEEFKLYFTLGVKINNLFKPDKLNDMMLTLPQFDEEFLSKITCPVYVVAGEHDIMKLKDTVFIHESIKNSEIAVFKGETHCSYCSAGGDKAYAITNGFIERTEQKESLK